MVKFVALLGLLGSIYEFGDCSNDMQCTSGQDGIMSDSFESKHPYDDGFKTEEWCLTPPAGKKVQITFGGFQSERLFDGLAIKVDGQTHLFSGDNNVANSGFVSKADVKLKSSGSYFVDKYPLARNSENTKSSAEYYYCTESKVEFHWMNDPSGAKWGYLINYDFVDECYGGQLQEQSTKDLCEIVQGPCAEKACSHACYHDDNEYEGHCACPNHLVLGPDDLTCISIGIPLCKPKPACTFESWQTEDSCQFSCDPKFPENKQKFMNHYYKTYPTNDGTLWYSGLFNSLSQITVQNRVETPLDYFYTTKTTTTNGKWKATSEKNKQKYCVRSFTKTNGKNKIFAVVCPKEKQKTFEWDANEYGQIISKKTQPKTKQKICWSVDYKTDKKSGNEVGWITGQVCDRKDFNQRFSFKNHEIRQKRDDGKEEFCAVIRLGVQFIQLRMVPCFGYEIRRVKKYWLAKFGSFPANVNEVSCDLPKVTFRNKPVLVGTADNWNKTGSLATYIWSYSGVQNVCMFNRNSNSLSFGNCDHENSESFRYYIKDKQAQEGMLSSSSKEEKCLGIRYRESNVNNEQKALLSFVPCDTDDPLQKWNFGGDNDTFIRLQDDDSLCIGADGLNGLAGLVKCDNSVNSVESVDPSRIPPRYQIVSPYKAFDPVSFWF